MKLSPEDVPETERTIFYTIQQLPLNDKQILWELIKRSNKDHTCVIRRVTPSVRRLISEGVITINHSYKDLPGTSLFVLRKAPFLMKKLQVMGQKE